jgi:membrane-bound lytic murein transglycosylase D
MARIARAAKRPIARHGLKVAIVALGAGIAAETATRTTTYLPKTPLVQRVAEATPATPPAPAATPSATSTLALDNGVDHARIDYWVGKLTTTLKDEFEKALDRKAKYDDMITAKLDAAEMPRDLVYLAMIESEFNPNAKSPVHAVGMWQFMSATARRFGLAVGKHVDERKDPARATDAAVKYLSSLHDEFGSWYLAAAAYNSGEGTVGRALKRITGRTKGTDADFFRILPALPKETRDYVPKLIAASRVGNDPEKYGLAVNDADGEVSNAPVAFKASTPATTAKPTARVVHSASKSTKAKSTSKAKKTTSRAKGSTHVRQHSSRSTRHR